MLTNQIEQLFYSPTQAAKMLRMRYADVRDLILKGEIPSRRRDRYVMKKDIERFAERLVQENKPKPKMKLINRKRKFSSEEIKRAVK